MAKGMSHFTKDGTPYYGEVHKMPDGSIHSGKTHTKTSKKVMHFKDLSTTAKNKAGDKMAKDTYKGRKMKKTKYMSKGGVVRQRYAMASSKKKK
jgi:hypothetical protein